VAIHVRVTASGRPVRRACVRLAGVHVFTDRRGRATVRHRFRRTGRVLAIARRRGDRAGRATLHVR
jgi:hypothetical protein